MKKIFAIVTIIMAIGIGLYGIVFAGEDHMDHSQMDMSKNSDQKAASKSFKHKDVDKGIRAEFEVMSLADMGMKPSDGATHHIMFKIFHDNMNHQIQVAKGRIKIIGPDGKEQISDIKNYNGIFAVNTMFPKAGKYGVICLLKIKDEKPLYKFWYTHKK